MKDEECLLGHVIGTAFCFIGGPHPGTRDELPPKLLIGKQYFVLIALYELGMPP